MKKEALLTTRILDTHGRIGPFFFKEFLIIFLVVTSLYFSTLLLSCLVSIPSLLLIAIPVSFLGIMGFIRLLFIKRIHSPWYIHQWILHRFLQPESIIANQLGNQETKLCFPTRKDLKTP